MIKKTITYIITLILILILYEVIFSFLKTGHNIEYQINKEKKTYIINEVYTKKKKDNYYLIEVKDNDDKYLFSVDNTFNKQKNIVKDIYFYQITDDLSCMSLSLINKKTTIPICIKDKALYSYYSLVGKYDLSALNDYINSYENHDYKVYDETNNKSTVYYSHIDANEYVALYNLKDIFFYHNNVVERLNFSNFDTYSNDFGYLVGKYYFIPRIISNPEIYDYLVYNVESKKTDSISLGDKPISKDMYINGAYEGSLYIVDRSNKRQIKLDPRALTAVEVGNVNQDGYAYINGKLEKMSIYKLIESNVIFTEEKGNFESIDADLIYAQSNYAYYLKNGAFYKVYEGRLDLPICLFSATNPSHVKFKNNNIYFVEDNKLYKYNEYGLNVLITKDEFRYHSDDFYDIYLN